MTQSIAHPATTALAERRISAKAFYPIYAGTVLAGIVIAVILFMTPFGFLAPLGVLPWLLAYGYAYMTRISTSYRLFPDRIEVESGLLSRKIENIELFRVRDVGLRQGVMGRISNFGDVYIHSTDSSTPDVHVQGIDAPKEFYQQVRQLVTESRAGHRTMIVEGADGLPEP